MASEHEIRKSPDAGLAPAGIHQSPPPADQPPQAEVRHPERWEHDLNPQHMAGQNVGRASVEQELNLPSAFDVKPVHRRLRDLNDEELKQIPILPAGARLQQGATYIDLRDQRCEEFTALGGMVADSGHFYVPKDQVPYPLWNRLTGNEKPEGRSHPDRPSR